MDADDDEDAIDDDGVKMLIPARARAIGDMDGVIITTGVEVDAAI